MKRYNVVWEIELNATSKKDAAKKAREVMLDPNSLATVFYVSTEDIFIDRRDDSTSTIDLSD